MTADIIGALRLVLGESGIVTDPVDVAPYLVDWRGLRRGQAPFVLRPADTDQLAASMRILAAAGIPVVPQGGNTSMVAGATPDESCTQAVVSLVRMNMIRSIDPVDMTMTVEAGLVLKAAQDAAAASSMLFPLSLAAEGSATIGGVIATNAGGNTTVRYGNARDLVLGLEVVLWDGRIWNGLRRLRKDNTGYALRHLFAGSEGTLGLITAATLRLWPKVREELVAFCAVPSEDAALQVYRRLQEQEVGLRAFEYMSGAGVDLVLNHIEGLILPLSAPAPHYVLVDISSSRAGAGLRSTAEAVLGDLIESGEILDAAIAESIAQREAIWHIREEHSEAQRRAGASIKNDVSVPVSSVPNLLRNAADACRKILPGIRPVPFGHIGDGNIHLNLLQPIGMEPADFLARADELSDAVNEEVRALGGSLSAEHGIGSLKVARLEKWHGDVELDLMRTIKRSLDPHCLLNPGKILAAEGPLRRRAGVG